MQQFTGGLVIRVLRDEFSHHRQLQNSLAKFCDVFLDGVELAEVFGEEGLGALVLVGFGDVQQMLDGCGMNGQACSLLGST
ncbi:hypothetical protein DF40_006915 [Stenotrophomonas maltophilia M30]|nr:hypothetical protein DF40_006915 [Stenotrophomonas maltophilia M30]